MQTKKKSPHRNRNCFASYFLQQILIWSVFWLVWARVRRKIKTLHAVVIAPWIAFFISFCGASVNFPCVPKTHSNLWLQKSNRTTKRTQETKKLNKNRTKQNKTPKQISSNAKNILVRVFIWSAPNIVYLYANGNEKFHQHLDEKWHSTQRRRKKSTERDSSAKSQKVKTIKYLTFWLDFRTGTLFMCMSWVIVFVCVCVLFWCTRNKANDLYSWSYLHGIRLFCLHGTGWLFASCTNQTVIISYTVNCMLKQEREGESEYARMHNQT